MYPELCQWPRHVFSVWRQTAKEEENLPFPPPLRSVPSTAPARPWPQRAHGFSSRKPDSDLLPRDKHTALPALCFFGPAPRKQTSAGSVPGRGTLQHGRRPSLPLLCPAESCRPAALSALRPCCRLHCGHAGFLHLQPEPTPVATGDWLPQKMDRRSKR